MAYFLSEVIESYIDLVSDFIGSVLVCDMFFFIVLFCVQLFLLAFYGQLLFFILWFFTHGIGQLLLIYLAVLFSRSTLFYLFGGPILKVNSLLFIWWSYSHGQLLIIYLAVLLSSSTLIYSPSGLILMINSYFIWLSYSHEILLFTHPVVV